jgi:hypothetical protein
MSYDLIITGLISGIVLFSTGYFIKSKIWVNSQIIETPNTPPTFNFTPEQIREINTFLDEGGKLNQDTNDKLDQDLKILLGEDYENYQADMTKIEEEFNTGLQSILDEEFSKLLNQGIDHETILELIGIIISFINNFLN